MTKKMKQKLLNTAIRLVNGKGQSSKERFGKRDATCLYVKKDHPGCFIGCQSEFKPFREIKEINIIGDVNCLIGEDFNGGAMKGFCKAFGIKKDLDNSFLSDFQGLHDDQYNWIDKRIRREPVIDFCKKYKLTVPKSQYAKAVVVN